MFAISNLKQSAYHSILRICSLVLAVIVVFDSGLLISNSAQFSDQAKNYLAAAVSVNVGVEPTELNQLTGRITELEQELNKKEREIQIAVSTKERPAADNSTLILSIILFIFLVLIVLNYVLDYLRLKSAIKQDLSPTT